MNDQDDITKKWIKESLETTSDGFTEKLMGRIEQPQVAIRFPFWQIVATLFSLLTIMGSVFFLKDTIKESMGSLDFKLPFTPTIIPLGLVLFVLFAAFQLINLRESQRKLQKLP